MNLDVLRAGSSGPHPASSAGPRYAERGFEVWVTYEDMMQNTHIDDDISIFYSVVACMPSAVGLRVSAVVLPVCLHVSIMYVMNECMYVCMHALVLAYSCMAVPWDVLPPELWGPLSLSDTVPTNSLIARRRDGPERRWWRRSTGSTTWRVFLASFPSAWSFSGSHAVSGWASERGAAAR